MIEGTFWSPVTVHSDVKVTLHLDRLTEPFAWKEPRLIVIAPTSDLFHELVDDWLIAKVFAVMFLADHHQFRVLTQRPERMERWIAGDGKELTREIADYSLWPRRSEQIIRLGRGFIDWPPDNVRIGVAKEWTEGEEDGRTISLDDLKRRFGKGVDEGASEVAE